MWVDICIKGEYNGGTNGCLPQKCKQLKCRQAKCEKGRTMKNKVIIKRIPLAMILISIFMLIVCGFTACGKTATDETTQTSLPDDAPIHMHTVVIDEAVEATCTSTGLTEGKHCSKCGEILVAQTEISPKEHREEIIPAIESTCTASGFTEGKKCTVCGEILVAQTEMPIKAHSEERIPAIESTCTASGLTEGKKCTVCGEILVAQTEMPIKAHNEEIIPAIESTCTATGLTEGKKCTVCGEIIVAQEEAAIKAHSYDDQDDAICNVCGYERYCIHHNTIVLVGKEATCTATGLTEGKKCSDCGEIVVTQEIISIKAHIEVIDPAIIPTCTSTGLTKGKHCSACGKILIEQDSLPLLDHIEGAWLVDKAATCTENGVHSRYCTSCGVKMDSTIAFSLGHIMSITVVRELGCTQDGVVRHECTRNGCEYSYEITTKAEHNMQFEEMVDATCTVDGHITYGCTKCDYEEITVIYGGHSYISEITKKSTGDEKGEITYTCSICQDCYTEEIPMLKTGISVLLIEDVTAWRTNTNVELLNALVDAEYIAYWEKLASSKLDTTDLLKYGIILIANDQTDDTYNNIIRNKEKLQNFANEGGVLIYGACDQGWSGGNMSAALLKGIEKGNYYSYRNYIVNAEHPIVTGALTDGISLTDKILYHNYASHTYFYRLPQGANIILQDAKGNPTLVEYELGSGHVIVSGLTWEHNAKYEYNPEGSYANTVYDDLIIYATTLTNTCEHEYDEGIKQEVSCTESGYTLYTCTVCGFAYKDQITQPLGHTVDEWVQTKAPTCTEAGVESGACTTCKEIQIRYLNVIPHTEGEWMIDREPTCTADGNKHQICNVCGTTINTESIAASGHVNGEWVVDHDPTCVEAGSKHNECLVCHVILEVATIPILEHNLSNGVCTMCGQKISKGLKFTLNEDGESYRVTGIGTCTDKDITVPSIYNGKPVTRVGARAFANCTSITSITFPTSVTIIDERVFLSCTSLKSVEIPSSVISIGEYAFGICDSLTNITVSADNEYYRSIDGNLYSEDGRTLIRYTQGKKDTSFTIPDSVTIIGDGAINRCPFLISIEIPNGVTSIGSAAFEHCTSLSSIEIPNGVITIGGNAFAHCASLGSVVIPDSVTEIGLSAFYDCSSLTELVLGNGITSIPGARGLVGVFNNCRSLISVTFGNNLKSIGENAFQYCTSLTSITIPDSVTSIGVNAFQGCTSLTCVTIGNSMKSIADNAFNNSISLESIEVDENNAYYKSIDGHLYSKDGATLVKYATGKKDMSFAIPEGVTSIGGYAFSYCSALTKITIPNTVKRINTFAFYRCTLLTNIMIPDSVISIASHAFCDCRSLASIIIPDSVTSIGDFAFKDCTSLTDIVIPNSLKSIEEYVFRGCTSLTSITIPASVTSIGDSAFYYCYSLIEVCNQSTLNITMESKSNGYVGYYAKHIINDKSESCLKFVDAYVFYDDGTDVYLVKYCGNSNEITLPEYDGGKEYGIWQYAFYDCAFLTSVTIPDSVTSIGDYAFYGCTSLASVTIPDSVTSIGNSAFSGCSSLTSIIIPAFVTSIGNSAFSGCSSLIEVCNKSSLNIIVGSTGNGYVGNYAKHITTDELQSAIKYVGDFVFFDNGIDVYLVKYLGNESEITLPQYDNGKRYGIWQYAFYGCDSLVSVTIPDFVNSIGEYAFYDCSLLASIKIPNTVTRIGYCAFYDCYSLTIYCEVKSKPREWDSHWTDSNRPIVWGYLGE
jgi:hypothetical protein